MNHMNQEQYETMVLRESIRMRSRMIKGAITVLRLNAKFWFATENIEE